MSKLKKPRPFLKWAGGKTQLTARLLLRTPEFTNYFEPFVGGGAFFFALWREGRIKNKAYLADMNQELIDTYRTIRDDVEPLIELLQGYPHNKRFFLKMRARTPDRLPQVERAARMIYLNKTCYNGLYRVNQQGKFNVPFGSYKSPKICDAENLRAVSQALQRVEIACASFESVLERATKGDLVYFDPPYQPISKTANFTSYHASGFNHKSQEQLHQVCHALTRNRVNFMLSNSSVALIRDLYCDNGFHVEEVDAIRAINSNPKKRGKLKELIVTNYEPERIKAETSEV